MRNSVLLALWVLLLPVTAARADTVRVGVAVSLKEAMTEVAAAYEKRSGDKVELSFGSSGQVMAQIRGGAAIDAFVSAANKQVDELVDEGLADGATRTVIAGNTLVLIVPSKGGEAIDSFASLARVPVKLLAVGEPKTVPAGQYAQQALENLKLSAALADKLVYGSNVRQVLDYVTRGEVTAGVVYATDARQAGEKVKVVATAPASSHDPIVYPAVVVKKTRSPAAAKRFLEYLVGDESRRILESRGFARPPAGDRPAGKTGRRP